jgi:hypothetical protein
MSTKAHTLPLIILFFTFCIPSSIQGQETELSFDDGSFEGYVGFPNGRGFQANGPFIPSSYPATLTQARFLTNGTQ